MDSCTLLLPLKFTEGAYFKLDCDISVVNLYILFPMGAITELGRAGANPSKRGCSSQIFTAAYAAFVNPYNHGRGGGGTTITDLRYLLSGFVA